MFLRLLTESFRRQKRRKALAAAAILLGTTAVTAMLALATTIGDRIHNELAVYGANIIVTPKAANLDVNIAGLNLKPATGNAYLHTSDLAKLKTIFWANNITAISPEFKLAGTFAYFPTYQGIRGEWLHGTPTETKALRPATLAGYWFDHTFGALRTGAPSLHPWWKIQGHWPSETGAHSFANAFSEEVVVGANLAKSFNIHIGDTILLGTEHEGRVVGVVSSGDDAENSVIFALEATVPLVVPLMQKAVHTPYSSDLTSIEIAARTRPEDAFARQNPDSLSPKQHEIWYCRPYANSIAYQIREAIPNSDAQQVRRVEQSEGTVLSRISGLMWLISAAALLAAGFAVSAAMATAVLERRTEIGLMRSLGAGKSAVAALFLTESTLLALLAGTGGYLAGSLLAHTLGRHIFPAEPTALFNPVLLPAILALAILVAIAGSFPSLRSALNANPTTTLRATD